MVVEEKTQWNVSSIECIKDRDGYVDFKVEEMKTSKIDKEGYQWELQEIGDILKKTNLEFVRIDKEYSSKALVSIFRRIKVEISEIGKEMPTWIQDAFRIPNR